MRIALLTVIVLAAFMASSARSIPPVTDQQTRELSHVIAKRLERTGHLPPGSAAEVRLSFANRPPMPHVAAYVEWTNVDQRITLVRHNFLEHQRGTGPWPRRLVYTLVHEWLHIGSIRYGGGLQPLTRSIEEGMADAIAFDEARRFCLRSRRGCRGKSWHNTLAYPQWAANFRKLSRYGSGSDTWRTRNARVWRRAFLHAGPEDRQSMLVHAGEQRKERS